MATPRQKIQVGVFLTICSMLLVGTLMILSGWQREETIPYVVEFDESVSGLFAGADVRYRGVPVGRVTDIRVMPTNRIRVRIEVKPSIIRVRQGMIAQLGTTGVTGQLYINLAGGGSDARVLAADAQIPSIPSLFSNLSAEIPTILASINSLLVRLDKALGEEGKLATLAKDVGTLITGFNTAMTDVSGRTVTLLDQVNALLESEARPMVAELRTSAQTTRHTIERIGPPLQAMLTNGARTFQQLEQQLASLDLHSTNTRLQLTLQSLTQLAEQFGRTSEELNLTLQHVRGNTTNAEFAIRQATRQLRETLLSAKQLFDYLEQDPSALLVGKRVPPRSRDGQQR